MLFWGTVVPYLLLQVCAPIKCGGWWRAAALLPLAGSVPVGWLAAVWLSQDANLWPIILIPTCAVAALYLAALMIAHSWRGRDIAGRNAKSHDRVLR